MKLERALDKCLREIQEHNATVEDCLARYPKQAEAMEPLLRLAMAIRQVPPVRPGPEFKRATRNRLLALSPRVRAAPHRNWVEALASVAGWLGRRAAVASAIAILLVIILGGGAAVAAAGSPPDSPLYPIKRAAEQARLLLTPDDAARARLHIAYAQRRLDEAVIMAQQGQEERARELLEEYKRELQAAVAVVEELTMQTTKLSAELQGEIAEHGKVLESTGEQVPPEVRHLGLAAAREARVGLLTLAGPGVATESPPTPTPTETLLIEELVVITATLSPTWTSTPPVATETPPNLEGSPAVETSSPTPTAITQRPTLTATQTPSPTSLVVTTSAATETPAPTQTPTGTSTPARFTPTPTSTPPRATPTATTPGATSTATPVPPTPTPTATPRAYPGPTETPSPTATPVPPTATPTPEAYPVPTDTATPEPTHTPPSALKSTPTPTQQPTDTPVPAPTDTPTTVPYPPPGG